jgi:uncharacterized protein (DUF433 family)
MPVPALLALKVCYAGVMANRIKSNPKVMFGKPVIAGTRITVEYILRCLAAGETPEEIVADYPPLTVEDIQAAQAFAADHLSRESVFAAE